MVGLRLRVRRKASALDAYEEHNNVDTLPRCAGNVFHCQTAMPGGWSGIACVLLAGMPRIGWVKAETLQPLMVVATKGPPATPVTLVTPADVRIDSQQPARQGVA